MCDALTPYPAMAVTASGRVTARSAARGAVAGTATPRGTSSTEAKEEEQAIVGIRAARPKQEASGWAYGLGVVIVRPTLLSTTRRDWSGGENIPATGGCVIALNHITKVDPLIAAHFVNDYGRKPRYLAKAGLFDLPVLGGLLAAAGQIPVQRESDGATAFDAAVQAVRDGACVVVYPEGTITRDPDLWPMTGRSGAARIALATGCPVIPVAQWGAQNILAPYGRVPRLVPRQQVSVKAGPPVDLSDLGDGSEQPAAADVVRATDRIMGAITALLAEIRQETPPTERFDPRVRGVSEYGRPRAVSPTDHEESA